MTGPTAAATTPTSTSAEEGMNAEQVAEARAAHARDMATRAASESHEGRLELPSLPHPSSTVSAENVVRQFQSVLELVLARLQQVADLNVEQWQRMGVVMDQMQATMKLAQVMIGDQDDALLRLQQAVGDLGVATTALARTNADWQGTMQALMQDEQQQQQGQQGAASTL